MESNINDVPEETHVVSTMTLYLGTDTRLRDEKDNRPRYKGKDRRAKTLQKIR